MTDFPTDLAEIIAPSYAPAVLDAMQSAALPDEAGDEGEVLDPPDRWIIGDDSQAEWAMAKLAAVDARIGAMKDHADALMARIDNWFHDEMEKRQGDWPSLRQQRAFFAAHLELYGRVQREDRDRKTINLVSGDVATRAQKARLVVEDEDALVAWALEHVPEMVRTRIDVPAALLKDALGLAQDDSIVVVTGTGEPLPDLPPGLAIEPEHVTVTVRPR